MYRRRQEPPDGEAERRSKRLFYSVQLDILQELLDDDRVTGDYGKWLSEYFRGQEGKRADGKSHCVKRKNWRMWYSRLPENVTA